jgi:hypothetical protein
MYVHAVRFSILLILSLSPPSRPAISNKSGGGLAPAGQTAAPPNQVASPAKQL